MSKTGFARSFARLSSLVLMITVGLALALSTGVPARAAVIDNAITNVQLREESVDRWGTATLDIDWQVPAGTSNGDTFVLGLPPQLRASQGLSFALAAPDGSVLANAVVSGDQVQFTMTAAAEGLRNVRGAAELSVQFTADAVPGQVNELVFTVGQTVFADQVEVTHIGVADGQWYKWGSYDSVPPTLNFGVIGARPTDAGQLVVFEDELAADAGYEFSCEVGNITVYGWGEPAPGLVNRTFLGNNDPDLAGRNGVSVEICTPTHVRVSYTVQAEHASVWADGNSYFWKPELQIAGAVVTDNSRTSFTNGATITQHGEQRGVNTEVINPFGGGVASGDFIQIVKYTGDDPVAGDFDEAPGLAVELDARTPITMTIVNAGSTVLHEVAVTDETTAGPAMTDLECTFPDGTTGVDWAGPFEVGASFDCTGMLPALNGKVQHSNTATVQAVGNGPVQASDSFNAIGPEVPAGNPTPSRPTKLPATGGAGR